MKINDIVYLVYESGTNGTAFRVKLVTDFVISNKPIYRGGGEICRADFLVQYGFNTGWRTPEEVIAARERDFSGQFRVLKRNLYSTWEEAKEVLNRRLEARLQSNTHCIEHCQRELVNAQRELDKAIKRLEKTQRFDLDSHFSDKPASYISPFTGESK